MSKQLNKRMVSEVEFLSDWPRMSGRENKVAWELETNTGPL